jgi:glucose/arabinose dehydrogenase
MNRNSVLATLASLGVLLSACGGGGGDSPSPAPSPPPPPPPPPADTTAPTTPSGVTAAAQSTSSILVSWTASTDATGIAGYRVFRDAGATALATVQTTSYTDTGLTASTSYSYTVVAVDSAPAANVSAASTAVSATTQAPPPPAVVRLAAQRVFSGLTLTAAHSMLRVPHDTSRWVVVQQDGHILSFADSAGVNTTSNVLDITDRVVFRNVHGLLGLAFHPNYPTDPRAYVAYTHEASAGVIVLRISEFTTADSGATLNPASEQMLFEMAQPGGHNNGGHLLFGPDGFLYLGIGDGGNDDSASGVAGNGQLTNNLLGKILRVDVNGSTGSRRYRIPADNPFATNPLCNLDGTGAANCPEIFAWGFRNPWRWSFDSQGGQLWLGDVGSHAREEVNRVVRGGNYGWRCFEGTMQTTLNCGTPTTPLLPPVAEYVHPTGQSVVGGFVYHGTAIPALVGRYIFADYNLGYFWNIATDTAPTRTVTITDGWNSGFNPASFTQDNDGELFFVDVRTGSIYKLIQG